MNYGPAETTSCIRLNDNPVVSLGVIRKAQANTIEISAGIHVAVKRLNERLKRIKIAKTSDDAVFILGAIEEVLLALGVGIVVLVLLFFRTADPAVIIPVSLIGIPAGVRLLGLSVNILTLLALVLATGLVVVDAIVVRKPGPRRLGSIRWLAYRVLAPLARSRDDLSHRLSNKQSATASDDIKPTMSET